jgi:hypothetical protein
LYFPEYTGFIFWDNGKVAFYCNNGKYETELMRECSPYNDCSIVDNEKRRVEMLSHILNVNDSKE